MSVYEEILETVFASGSVDASEGAYNLQVQVQVEFEASQMWDQGQITEEEYREVLALVKKNYPTTAKPH